VVCFGLYPFRGFPVSSSSSRVISGPVKRTRRRGRLLLAHEAGTLLRVAGPIILSQLGGVGMNTLDTIMVGPLGAEALAAAPP
jgi:Na+-driven multidrug efflux pump